MPDPKVDVLGGLAPEHVLVEVRDRWAAALESGRFVPGVGRLHRHTGVGPDTFCAVGVLLEVLVELGYAERDGVPAMGSCYRYAAAGSTEWNDTILPGPLRAFLGWDAFGAIPAPYPGTVYGCQTTWYQLNDYAQMPFDRYAGVVREFARVS